LGSRFFIIYLQKINFMGDVNIEKYIGRYKWKNTTKALDDAWITILTINKNGICTYRLTNVNKGKTEITVVEPKIFHFNDGTSAIRFLGGDFTIPFTTQNGEVYERWTKLKNEMNFI